jgi:hypothetical protein
MLSLQEDKSARERFEEWRGQLQECTWGSEHVSWKFYFAGKVEQCMNQDARERKATCIKWVIYQVYNIYRIHRSSSMQENEHCEEERV